MAKQVGDSCRNCGAELAPGSSFCTLCGTAVLNRAALPASEQAAGSVPGIIPVGVGTVGPLVVPQHVGENAQFAAAAMLVPGGAGRRLVAKLIDGVPPAIILGAATAVGTAQLLAAASGDSSQANPALLLILLAAGSLLATVYGLWLWIWESRTGKTPGNVMMGLRTTNLDGGPAGIIAIFLRGLVIAVASIVPGIGPLLVIISNAWDANGKRQGWHDKAAHTFVFNVKTGRNPMETGGVAGRADYAPAPVPTLSPVHSPIPGAQTGAGRQGSPDAPVGTGQPGTQQNLGQPAGPITSIPGFSGTSTGAGTSTGTRSGSAADTPYSESASFAPPSTFAPPSAPAQSANHPDVRVNTGTTDPLTGVKATAPLGMDAQGDTDGGDAGETRIRPAAPKSALQLTFDDGSIQLIDAVALIGRNPAGYDGEMITALIPVRDAGMSVSKTHLHVRASNEGLWVIDRNSTNGSAISNANGVRTALAANVPALAESGARVHFGDRSFVVGRA